MDENFCAGGESKKLLSSLQVAFLCISQSDCIKKIVQEQKNRFEAKLTTPKLDWDRLAICYQFVG